MNERIKELARQARYDSRNEKNDLERVHNREITLDEYQEIYDRKFAELIIRECMDVVKGMRNPPNLNYKPGDKFIDELRLHFRVEE